jgi:endonuclease V-like protein UPF0215 family
MKKLSTVRNEHNEVCFNGTGMPAKSVVHAFASNDIDEAYMDFTESITKGFTRLKDCRSYAKDMFLSTRLPVMVISLTDTGYRLRIRKRHLYA